MGGTFLRESTVSEVRTKLQKVESDLDVDMFIMMLGHSFSRTWIYLNKLCLCNAAEEDIFSVKDGWQLPDAVMS